MSEDWEKICSDLDNNTNSEKGFNDTINKAEALKKNWKVIKSIEVEMFLLRLKDPARIMIVINQ